MKNTIRHTFLRAAAPLSVCAVFAVTAAAQSPSAGIAIPKGASPVNDSALRSGFGRFAAAEAQEFKLPARSGGPATADVFFWTGANYKSSRAPFVRAQLQNALTAAGYVFTEVDPSSENTPNPFDTDAYATGPLDLSPADGRGFYFHATNPEKKRTIVGVWLNQESQNRLVLAMGEVGYNAAAAPTKAPDTVEPGAWLVRDLANATKGMPAPPLPTFPKLAPKPGTVRGVALDGSGKPIAGAHFIAWASAAGGFRTSAEGRTNAQGIYEIQLPIGICQIVNADCRVRYNGKSYLLPLHPADGERDNFNSKTGHVENFVLRTSGIADDTGANNYGAPMRVLSYVPPKSIVEVTLKPVGPLLDGSQGKTLVFRFPPMRATSSSETFLAGIPIGRYTLSAKVYDGDDALPLRARTTFGDDMLNHTLHASLPIEFETEPGANLASLGRSGIRRFEVTLEP